MHLKQLDSIQEQFELSQHNKSGAYKTHLLVTTGSGILPIQKFKKTSPAT